MSNDRPFDEVAAGHLSMDEIADLGEGLLSDEQASAARAHLAGCAECNDRSSALDATTAALRGLGPVTMPDDVAARIDASLAAEAAAPAPADAVVAGNVTVMPDPTAIPRQRFRRLPTAPAAAAAVVIVLAAVAIVVGHGHGHHHNGITIEQAGPAEQPLVSTAPGNAATLTPVSTGRVYDTANLASYVPALLTARIPGVTPTATSTSSGLAGGSTDGTTSHSTSGGNNLAPGSIGSGSAAGSAPTHRQTTRKQHRVAHKNDKKLGQTVTAPVAAPAVPPALSFNAEVPAASAQLFSDRAALLECGATATDTPGAVPLAVDFGRWKSPTAKKTVKPVPAVIFVFASVSDSSLVDVYVVPPNDCRTVLHAQFGVAK